MNKFQNAVYQFMLGRYGSDQFNVFLVILAIVLMILNLFFIRNSFLSAIVWLILIYSLYRIYSRNIYRRRAENDKYLSIIQPIQKRISMIKKNREDHEHKYFLCPECKQTVRVPRGHGKITPKCSHKFDKKS
ncbi:hypothetical protein [Thomasclavelia cocleata]|uniref:hypothetical protein n=1 Tax=Thomasclavelia cocleata TaxID=69824 RepID=UPI00262E4533|nr:hypothetical protein [Thomasclavelia cocleata]